MLYSNVRSFSQGFTAQAEEHSNELTYLAFALIPSFHPLPFQVVRSGQTASQTNKLNWLGYRTVQLLVAFVHL